MKPLCTGMENSDLNKGEPVPWPSANYFLLVRNRTHKSVSKIYFLLLFSGLVKMLAIWLSPSSLKIYLRSKQS